MKTQIIHTGGGNQLVQVNDDDKVIVIGDGYVTVWDSIADFYDHLDGADNEPQQSMSY